MFSFRNIIIALGAIGFVVGITAFHSIMTQDAEQETVMEITSE